MILLRIRKEYSHKKRSRSK